MKLFLNFLFQNDFMKASYILVGGTFFVSVLNYFFTLVMGRMLGPVGFGEMSSIFSLLVIIGVPSATLSLFIAKCVADHNAKDEPLQILGFMKLLYKFVLIIGFIFFLLTLVLIPFISSFLDMHKASLLIFSFLIPLGFLSSFNAGVLQGMQKFFNISASNIISTILKLLFGVILVYFGYYVSGVVLAVGLASFLGLWYSYWIIKKEFADLRYITEIHTEISVRDYLPFLKLAFYANLLFALLMNVDIILAKHFFDPILAGQYSALSVVGKIIIYATGSFVTVMFPMVSASYSKKDNRHKRILFLSLAITSVISVAAVICFFTFPHFIVKILFGSAYVDIVPYLGYFGLIALLYSVCTALVSYFVAIQDSIFFYISIALLAIQTILLSVYHQNIVQFVIILISFAVLLTLSLVVNLLFSFRKVSDQKVNYKT